MTRFDTAAKTEIDWYERRNELEPGMVFNSCWGVVKLDRTVPGDGTRWYVADWRVGYSGPRCGTVPSGWSYEDSTIEPGDLIERLPDDYAGDGSPLPSVA